MSLEKWIVYSFSVLGFFPTACTPLSFVSSSAPQEEQRHNLEKVSASRVHRAMKESATYIADSSGYASSVRNLAAIADPISSQSEKLNHKLPGIETKSSLFGIYRGPYQFVLDGSSFIGILTQTEDKKCYSIVKPKNWKENAPSLLSSLSCDQVEQIARQVRFPAFNNFHEPTSGEKASFDQVSNKLWTVHKSLANPKNPQVEKIDWSAYFRFAVNPSKKEFLYQSKATENGSFSSINSMGRVIPWELSQFLVRTNVDGSYDFLVWPRMAGEPFFSQSANKLSLYLLPPKLMEAQSWEQAQYPENSVSPRNCANPYGCNPRGDTLMGLMEISSQYFIAHFDSKKPEELSVTFHGIDADLPSLEVLFQPAKPTDDSGIFPRNLK